MTRSQTCDGAGRMTRLTWSQEGNTLPDFGYAYDPAGNILTKTHLHRGGTPIEKHDIDGLYRLTGARYDYRDVTHGFTYDDLGNQLTYSVDGSETAYLHSAANEVTKAGGTDVLHERNGNLTKDAQGYGYYYDRQNQLTCVTKPAGEGEAVVAEYAYDAFGRRIQIVDAANATTRRCYHDGQRVLVEMDAARDVQRHYVWGGYIDELVVFRDVAGGGHDYFACHNHLYSPEALLDDTGAIVERYDYDAYGRPLIYTAAGDDDTWFTDDDTTAAQSAVGNPYLFTGREYDCLDAGDLALQYNRARYYSFTLRGWLQRDPAGYPSRPQKCAYVHCVPLSRRDPFGLYDHEDEPAMPDRGADEDPIDYARRGRRLRRRTCTT